MDESQQKEGEDFYRPIDNQSDGFAPHDVPEVSPMSWTASEFLYHQKNPSWYFFAVLALVILSLLLFVLTRDFIGPISVLVLGALLLVGAARKPRTVAYSVSPDGITIGAKSYLFDDFQSFTIINEGHIESIALYPHKRFMPIVSMYFPPEDGQKIFDVLSEFLPFEQRERDQIDKFLHKIRF